MPMEPTIDLHDATEQRLSELFARQQRAEQALSEFVQFTYKLHGVTPEEYRLVQGEAGRFRFVPTPEQDENGLVTVPVQDDSAPVQDDA